MVLGQTVRAITGDGGTAKSIYFGPWFPRQGSRAVFGCELVVAFELSSFKVLLETKKREDDDGSASPVGSAATISLTPGVTAFEAGQPIDGGSGDAMLELMRYVYEVTSNDTKKGWCHFRMLNPTWETD